MNSIMYALLHKETMELMGYRIQSNDGAHFCNDYRVILCTWSDSQTWVTHDLEIARKAAVTDTPWYNSDMDTPENEFIGELEVVRLDTTITLAD